VQLLPATIAAGQKAAAIASVTSKLRTEIARCDQFILSASHRITRGQHGKRVYYIIFTAMVRCRHTASEIASSTSTIALSSGTSAVLRSLAFLEGKMAANAHRAIAHGHPLGDESARAFSQRAVPLRAAVKGQLTKLATMLARDRHRLATLTVSR
jgi:hypothetical protein